MKSWLPSVIAGEVSSAFAGEVSTRLLAVNALTRKSREIAEILESTGFIGGITDDLKSGTKLRAWNRNRKQRERI